MKMQVKCPLCEREWDFEFNYCPIDGRSLRSTKADILNPHRRLAELPIVDTADLSQLYLDTFGPAPEIPPPVNVEQVRRWLSRMNPQWAQVLIRYYGLDGKRRRTYAQIGAETAIEGTGVKAKADNGRRRLRAFFQEDRRKN